MVYRKSFFYVFLIIIAAFFMKIHYLANDGFKIHKVLYHHHFVSDWDVSYSKKEKQIALNILSQPFKYLGKGRQSYVFVSDDDKYVLKLIRYHKCQMPFFTSFLDYFHFSTLSYRKMIEDKKERIKRGMTSYKIAYENLKDITLVEFVHLNPTNDLKKTVIIKDKKSKKYFIDLDNVAFIIQKKAIPLKDSILKEKNNLQNLKPILISYVSVGKKCLEKKVFNRDLDNLIRNAGCYNNRVIHVDIGSFYILNNPSEEDLMKDFNNYILPMHKLLKSNIPEAIPFFDELISL